MAGIDDPFAPYGLTREQMGQAVNAFDGRGVPFAPGPVPATTLQPLTPEEQAFGAQLADQREQEALTVINSGRAHQAAPPAAGPMGAPSTPSLDWQPEPQQALTKAPVQGVFAGDQATSPGARPRMPGMTLELPPGLLTGGGGNSYSRSQLGLRSPLPGMQKEAGFRAQEAHDLANVEQDKGDSAFNRQLGTEAELGDIRSKTQGDVAGVNQRLVREGDEHQVLVDLARQTHEEATLKTEKESRELADEIRTYEPRDRRTMGDRVAQSLAIFGGAIGDAFQAAGGQQGNHAAMVIQNIKEGIQTDLEQQDKLNSNQKTALVAKNDELGRMQERFADKNMALNGAWLMKLDQADHELKGVLASGASDETKALAQQTISGLQVERSGLERQMQLGIEDKNRGEADQLALARYKEQRAAAAGNDPLKRAERLAKIQKLMAETGKTYQEADKLFQENQGGGSDKAAFDIPGYSSTLPVEKADATVAKKVAGAANSIKSDLQRLRQMRDANGGGTWDRNDIHEAKQILGTLPSRYSQTFGSGAPNNTELEIFKENLVDPTEFQNPVGRDIDVALQRLEQQVDRTSGATLSAYGYVPTNQSQAQGRVRQGAAR